MTGEQHAEFNQEQNASEIGKRRDDWLSSLKTYSTRNPKQTQTAASRLAPFPEGRHRPWAADGCPEEMEEIPGPRFFEKLSIKLFGESWLQVIQEPS